MSSKLKKEALAKAPERALRLVPTNPNLVSCRICSLEFELKVRATLKAPWLATRCPQCEVAFVHPFPDTDVLKNHYNSEYAPTEITDTNTTVLVDRHKPIVEYLVGRLPKTRPLRFLDYGFGAGAFLRQVALSGHKARGLDFSGRSCEAIRILAKHDRTDIRVDCLADATLSTLLRDEKFDCITLFQVIEHLLDPVAVLRDLANHLQDGGILFLECPNEDALYLKMKNAGRNVMNRENFYGSLNPPQHLHGFNRKSMETLLESANLKTIEVSDYPFRDDLHQVETTTYYPSRNEFLKNGNWDLYSVSKYLIGAIDGFASRRLRRGGGLYAIAKKR